MTEELTQAEAARRAAKNFLRTAFTLFATLIAAFMAVVMLLSEQCDPPRSIELRPTEATGTAAWCVHERSLSRRDASAKLLHPATCSRDKAAARALMLEVEGVRQHQHAACTARVGDPITRPGVFFDNFFRRLTDGS